MLLGRGEILDIINEKIEELHSVRTWEATHHAKVQVLEELRAEIKKREEG